MAVQINLGPLSMDLEKLLVIIKELFSVKLDKGAKDAIKELIDELMKLYDDIVKTLLPFYDIIDDATFEKKFASQFRKFKEIHTASHGQLRYHCHVVQDELERLSKEKGYLEKFPRIRKNILKFKDSADTWILVDEKVYKTVGAFHTELLKELEEIYKSLGKQPTIETKNRLHALLLESGWDKDFFKIKDAIDEFRRLTRKL
jgi:hypothetical protein